LREGLAAWVARCAEHDLARTEMGSSSTGRRRDRTVRRHQSNSGSGLARATTTRVEQRAGSSGFVGKRRGAEIHTEVRRPSLAAARASVAGQWARRVNPLRPRPAPHPGQELPPHVPNSGVEIPIRRRVPLGPRGRRSAPRSEAGSPIQTRPGLRVAARFPVVSACWRLASGAEG
jgi:hypothetical protein